MSEISMATLDSGLDLVMSAKPSSFINTLSPQIFQADTIDRNILPRNSTDLIITSPPYNVSKPYNGTEEGDSISYEEYANFSKKWLANCFYWSRTSGRLCVNVSIDKNKNGKQPLSPG